MDSDLRENLPTIAVITIIGVVTSAFGLLMVHDNASSLDAKTFLALVIIIPCAVMVLASFAITLVAPRIGRQLYIAILGLCLLFGVISMFVTSAWTSDSQITAQLLANSSEDTVILPILQSPIVMLRDIAAFIVCPTIGSIVGAWVGSRLHPVEANRQKSKNKKKRRR